MVKLMDEWMDGGGGSRKKDADGLAVQEMRVASFLYCCRTHGYRCMYIYIRKKVSYYVIVVCT